MPSPSPARWQESRARRLPDPRLSWHPAHCCTLRSRAGGCRLVPPPRAPHASPHSERHRLGRTKPPVPGTRPRPAPLPRYLILQPGDPDAAGPVAPPRLPRPSRGPSCPEVTDPHLWLSRPTAEGTCAAHGRCSPTGDPLPAPQHPAGETPTRGPSCGGDGGTQHSSILRAGGCEVCRNPLFFNVHLRPRGAIARCPVRRKRCRNTAPSQLRMDFYGDGY